MSIDGLVALPEIIRTKLGLTPGMKLECHVEAGQIVLRPTSAREPSGKARIGVSEVTGLPVLIGPDDAPTLTPEMVKAALVDFP
jgi:bifunctional DNA-binding transcriptional regulator/antitoxin component of YhaV-PrlF toxin-antitoxin module